MQRDYLVEFCGNAFACLDTGFGIMEEVDVVIRPEDITLTDASDESIKGIKGLVETVTFKGVHYEIIVNTLEDIWVIHSTKARRVGDVVGISLAPGDIHIMKKSERPKVTRYTVNPEVEADEANK